MKKLILTSSATALAVATMSAAAWWHVPPYVGPYATDDQRQALSEQQRAVVEGQQAIAAQQAEAVQELMQNQREAAERWAGQAAKSGYPQMPERPWAVPRMPAQLSAFPAIAERPAIPPMAEIPDFGERPSMPEIPAFGERPSTTRPALAGYPDIPQIPAMPEPRFPPLPELRIPERPNGPDMSMPELPIVGRTLEERKARIAAHRVQAKERLDARRFAMQRARIERRLGLAPYGRGYRAVPMPVSHSGSGVRNSEPAVPADATPAVPTDATPAAQGE